MITFKKRNAQTTEGLLAPQTPARDTSLDPKKSPQNSIKNNLEFVAKLWQIRI
jgi:hypothetical protein